MTVCTPDPPPSHRAVLVVDDNPAIHKTFRRILCTRKSNEDVLAELDAEFFGEPVPQPRETFALSIDSAHQGQEALGMLEQAMRKGRPYSLAFVDFRMPPGWDGVETILHLWAVDPTLHVVLCSAYTDFDWTEIVRRLGASHRLLILKKPFEVIEAQQIARVMTQKWVVERASIRAA